MSELVPGDELGGYVVERRIGAGGMGIIYLAREPGLDRLVAIKVISDASISDSEFRERFRREALHFAAVDHPNVVPIYSVGEHETSPYIVMRYVPGGDLETRIHEDGPLTTTEAVSLVRQLGAALDAAHAKGLVHRDVKPANVLIEGHDSDIHVYLTDFGLTKAVNETTSLTRSDRIILSPPFASPEQVDDKPVGPPADIYSLGCVLFYALSSEVPFKGSVASVLVAQLKQAVPLLPPTVEHSERFDRVIERATAKDPEERWPSGSAMARACTTVGSAAAAGGARTREMSSTVPMVPGSTAPTTVMRRPRRKVLLAALAGIFVVAAAGIAGILSRQGDQGGASTRPETVASSTTESSTTTTAESTPSTTTTAPTLQFASATLDSESGATADLPFGDRSSESFGGERFRTRIETPSGSVAIVDYTPAAAPDPGDAFQPTGRQVYNAALGVNSSELLARDCGEGPVCVDYPLDLGGHGFGVMGVATSESEAREIARRVARTLSAELQIGPYGTLTSTGVGPVQLDMTDDEVTSYFGEPDEIATAAALEVWSWYLDDGSLKLHFPIGVDRVAGYFTDSGSFSTTSGLSVGQPIAPLIAKYGSELISSSEATGTYWLSEGERGSYPAMVFFAPNRRIKLIGGGSTPGAAGD